MKKLGDTHNFGKYVFEAEEYIFKPRPLLWEYLFLSESSPLRSLIHSQCQLRQVASPFNIAPNLNAQFKDPKNGNIEKAVIADLKHDKMIRPNDFSSIGSMLGLCFWFGLGDLHNENIAIGLNSNDQLICFPIDIECIFDQMTHIKQTLLIPSDRISHEYCGLAKLWSTIEHTCLENKLSLIRSFADSLNLYNSLAKEVFDLIIGIEDIEQHTIRIILRDTKFYTRAIEHQSYDDVLEIEKVQMLRGEIPYFFRKPSSASLFYYETRNQETMVKIEGDLFNLPSPICLVTDGQNHLIKLKTAILSIKYLAEKLSLNSELKRIGHADIITDSGIISFYEHENKIIYSNF